MDVSNGLPNPGNGPGYYYVPPNAFITTNLSSSPSAPASIRRPTPTGRGPGRALGSRFPSGYRKLSGLNPEDLEHIEQILSQKFIDLEKKQEEKRLKELAWFQSVLNTGADITSKAPPKTSTKKHQQKEEEQQEEEEEEQQEEEQQEEILPPPPKPKKLPKQKGKMAAKPTKKQNSPHLVQVRPGIWMMI